MEKKKMKTSTKLRLKAVVTGVVEILLAPIIGPIHWVIGGVTMIATNKTSGMAFASQEECDEVLEENFDKMVKDFEKKHEENKEN